MPDESLLDAVHDLADEVRELRDREVAAELEKLREEVAALRAEKGGHPCHGHCSCHWHFYCTPTWNQPIVNYPQYYTVTTGTTSGYGQTFAAAGCAGGNSTYTVPLGN